MTSSTVKIVVVGAVGGAFRSLFARLNALHTKNAFGLGIITGDLFSAPEAAPASELEDIRALIAGRIPIAFPIYFALGAHPLPPLVIEQLEKSGSDVSENLIFLGKRTTFKSSEGVRIVALGGLLDPALHGLSKDKYTPLYSEEDVRALRGAHRADVLITGQWPRGIQTGSKVQFQASSSTAQPLQCITDLNLTLMPRYHFSSSHNTFYEREPFFHPKSEESEAGYRITRFISVASFNNPGKAKWIYAFSLEPQAADPLDLPDGCTAAPFTSSNRKRADHDSQRGWSRYDNRHEQTRQHVSKKRRLQPVSQADCFFCLSNPNIATHLITSIGDFAYVTIAKGPLSTRDTFADLGFPAHLLVIPFNHSATLSEMADESTRKDTLDEMERFNGAVRKTIAKASHSTLGTVTWEFCRRRGVHLHWQILPARADEIEKGLVEAAFQVQAENDRIPSFHPYNPDADVQETAEYLNVRMWTPGDALDDTGKETCLKVDLGNETRVDALFPRRVMAKLLGLESRLHWQTSKQTDVEETADAEAFKKQFEAFDFTS